MIDVFIPLNAATLSNVFSICLLIGDEFLKIGTIKALQLFVPCLFKQCKQMNCFNEVIHCFDETFERCTHLTSDKNERVSDIAHEFILELTKRGYEAADNGQMSNKLMNKMYPSFKSVDLDNDGVQTSMNGLHKILEKCEELLKQYPDTQSMDHKLHRLLHRKPKDSNMKNERGNNVQKSNNLQPKRRQSQMPNNNANNNNLQLSNSGKSQLSFMQKSEEPMQHSSLAKAPPRLVIKPQKSILAEDEEQNTEMESVEMYNQNNNKPKHRDLLSDVTAISGVGNFGMGVSVPNVMNMGSYRDLRNERAVTVEKLEKIVNKQFSESASAPPIHEESDENMRENVHFGSENVAIAKEEKSNNEFEKRATNLVCQATVAESSLAQQKANLWCLAVAVGSTWTKSRCLHSFERRQKR